MKIYIYLLPVFLLLLIIPLVIHSRTPSCESGAFLVFDHSNVDWLIAKKFRSGHSLGVSASGQFSEPELQKLLKAIPRQPNQIWVVDLRQESHGFINGVPISWYARRNCVNDQKSSKKIETEERTMLKKLGREELVTVYSVKKLAEGDVTADKPTRIKPKLIQTEQQLVQGVGADYYRLYVLDHNRPDDQTVDNYVRFIKDKVKPQDWLHFHCRGGKGRSSTFVAMLDMIRHASTTSFAEIMQRQVDMGNINLSAFPTDPEKLWKAAAARERYEFLQKFYDYASDPNGYAKRSWGEWLKHNSKKK